MPRTVCISSWQYLYYSMLLSCYVLSYLKPLETCGFATRHSFKLAQGQISRFSLPVSTNNRLQLRGGADDDSEQNLIGDLVLDDIEGRTLEQEIEALERELEEAHDSRAVAEQV